MRFAYVSEGNIPSLAANSVQVMKMSQAFAKLLPSFELVTLGDLLSSLRGRVFDFWTWYGIQHPFRITRLPLLFSNAYPYPANYRHPHFPFFASLYALARRSNIIYTRSKKAACYAMNWGVPVILEVHSQAEPGDCMPGGLLFHKNLVGLVTVSPTLATSYENAGLSTNKLLVAEDAVDLERFKATPAKMIARRKLSLSKGPLAIYAGHLYQHRGIEIIFDLAALSPEIQFLLIGGWPDDVKRRQREIEDRSLSNVTLTGFLPNGELPLYLSAADVLMMPYADNESKEGWRSPLKMFEYMAAGRPILASNLASVRRVLRHGESAWLTEAENVRMMHQGMRHLISNPDYADQLGRNARQAVEAYTWDVRAKTIIEKFKVHFMVGVVT